MERALRHQERKGAVEEEEESVGDAAVVVAAAAAAAAAPGQELQLPGKNRRKCVTQT